MTERRNWISGVLVGVSLSVVAGSIWYAMDYKRDLIVKENKMQVLRDMIATTRYGFVVLNPEGKIVEWGPGAERLFGWMSAEVIGSPPDFLMPEKFRIAHELAMKKENYDFSRSLIEVDCWAYHKNGQLIPIHIVAASFRNHRGFYHVALFTPSDQVRQLQTPKPEDKKPPPLPHAED